MYIDNINSNSCFIEKEINLKISRKSVNLSYNNG